MRVVFLGTPEFAIPSLKALLTARDQFDLVGVVTQPDRPAGRGQKLNVPPVKQLAERHGVPVFQTHRLRENPEALEFLRSKEPEVNVVVAFGQILPLEFFDFPPLGSLNVHASLLPKYRGAAPVIHALLNGETQNGVTIMKIDEGMDTGDILSQVAVPVSEDMTAGELEPVLARKGAELLVQTIPGYEKGEIRPRSQDHTQVTYAPRIKKEDGRIDWNRTAESIHNLVRGLNPWPAAFATFRRERLKIWRTTKLEQAVASVFLGGQSGMVVAVENKIIVECGEQTFLSLLELQLPNRKRVSARRRESC
jgi:methionyl-tRNA formyltransferase